MRGLRIPVLLATKVIGRDETLFTQNNLRGAKDLAQGCLATALLLPAFCRDHGDAWYCEKGTKDPTEDNDCGECRVGMKCANQKHLENLFGFHQYESDSTHRRHSAGNDGHSKVRMGSFNRRAARLVQTRSRPASPKMRRQSGVVANSCERSRRAVLGYFWGSSSEPVSVETLST